MKWLCRALDTPSAGSTILFQLAATAAAAGAAAASSAATPIAQNRAAVPIVTARSVRRDRCRRILFVEPDARQILVGVVARANLPAVHIGAQRHDPTPPERVDVMRAFVEHLLVELAGQRALLRKIGLVQQLVVDFV